MKNLTIEERLADILNDASNRSIKLMGENPDPQHNGRFCHWRGEVTGMIRVLEILGYSTTVDSLGDFVVEKENKQ